MHIDKGFVGKIPRTLLSLTDSGRSAVERHWQQLESLRRGAQEWQPPQEEHGTEIDSSRIIGGTGG